MKFNVLLLNIILRFVVLNCTKSFVYDKHIADCLWNSLMKKKKTVSSFITNGAVQTVKHPVFHTSELTGGLIMPWSGTGQGGIYWLEIISFTQCNSLRATWFGLLSSRVLHFLPITALLLFCTSAEQCRNLLTFENKPDHAQSMICVHFVRSFIL